MTVRRSQCFSKAVTRCICWVFFRCALRDHVHVCLAIVTVCSHLSVTVCRDLCRSQAGETPAPNIMHSLYGRQCSADGLHSRVCETARGIQKRRWGVKRCSSGRKYSHSWTCSACSHVRRLNLSDNLRVLRSPVLDIRLTYCLAHSVRMPRGLCTRGWTPSFPRCEKANKTSNNNLFLTHFST